MGHAGETGSGRCGPGPVLEGAQASVTRGAGLAEAWLLVEAPQLHQQLLDEVLGTGQGALTPRGGVGAPAQPSPSDPRPSFSCFLSAGWGGREVREGERRWRQRRMSGEKNR